MRRKKILMIYKRTEESERILKQIYACIDENEGIAKKEQLVEIGIDYRRVLDFVESGEIIRIKNGYYTYEMDRFSEDALVSKLFSDGVLCMESALYAYGYISTKPAEYHVAIDKNTSKSRFKLDYPKVIPYYTEPEVLKMGVKEIQLENCKFQVYDKDRLICDCLKYESKMDRKVFKEALQAYINDQEKDIAALMEYAKERKVFKRVQSVILVWLDDEPVQIKENSTKNKLVCINEKKTEFVFEESGGENNTLAEDIFEIMKKQEMISNMASYERINEKLKEKVVSGLYTFQELKDLKETNQEVVTMERLQMLSEYKNHITMKKKWQQYIKVHGKKEEDWESVMERIFGFVGPIWKSLCKDEVFFDDWMPELERFLG